MKKTLTLKASYATANTVRFVEDELKVTEVPSHDFLAKSQEPKVEGALGKPVDKYFDTDALAALAWNPTKVGDPYVAVVKGKEYTRRDIEGPRIKLTIETL